MNLSECITRSTTTVLAFDNDSDFENILLLSLNFVGSPTSPIMTQKWLSNTTENIIEYSGIIVLNDTISKTHEPENLGEILGKIFLIMGGKALLPTDTQKVLICKNTSLSIIRSFANFYKIEIEEEFTSNDDIFFWSTIRYNETYLPLTSLKKSRWYQ